MSKFFRLEAIVLKRHNFGDADRFVTIFSRERGKMSLLAKGVRKIKSKKRSSLEIGNLVKIQAVEGKSASIVTQTQLIRSFYPAKNTLTKITQTYQILEIVDSLTAEDSYHPQVFFQLSNLLHLLQKPGNHRQAIVSTTKSILVDLGFGLPSADSEEALKNHLESITERPLRSKIFLSI